MSSTDAKPDAVKAGLLYFVPPADGSRAWQFINADPKTGERARNFTNHAYEMEVENIRGKEDTVNLDTAGFLFAKAEAKHKTFTNDEEIEKEYYPESAELLKTLTGASRVVFFDHSELIIIFIFYVLF